MDSDIEDAGASPQLACRIVNAGGGRTTENVIFVTADAAYNRASLWMALTSGSTILTPGAIPDPLSPPGTDEGTTIYLDLSALELTAEGWERITFEGTGWRFQKFAELGMAGMTPADAPIPLSSGTAGAISIGIDGIVVPKALAVPQVQLFVAFYNIRDVSGPYSTFAVALQNPPDAQDADLSDAIAVSLSADGIVNTVGPVLKAANRFALQFANLGRRVPAGPNTTFSVSFAYGVPDDAYGYGALTSVARAIEFSVRQGDNTKEWTITPDKNAQAVTWALQPPEGEPIVGTDEKTVAAINFSNVVTTYMPGPTAMLISYRGIPGYRDGTFTLVLNKIPHVRIDTLDVTPNPSHFTADGSAKVTVSWDAADAQSLELTQNYLTTPVTGKTELPATLRAEVTTFALKATGRPGTVDNSDYKSVQAIALPVINSFAGAPTEIYYGAVAHDASFDWAVGSPSDVRLYSTGDAFGGQSFPPTGRTSAVISQIQMVTLTPVAAASSLTLTRRLVISAFRPAPQHHSLAFTPAYAVASPIGPFVVLAGPSTALTVVDTVSYDATSTFDLEHPASALVFSADGRTLATANTDKTVTVVSVDPGPAGMPSFGNPSTVTLSDTPRQLVFSPDGQRIFVTLDPGDDHAGRVVSLLKSRGGGYQVEGQPVRVGLTPRGITLDAAGARLFVANSGDETVTMIGLTRDGRLGSTTAIGGFTGGPTGVAATPSGKQLLVSCGNANGAAGSVVAIDPDHPELGQRRSMLVGGTPGQLALLPSGSYAAVANRKNGTISLLDCWGQPTDAEIAGPAVPVGTAPTGITASPDGLQVLVAVDGGFCVVTLATYQVLSAQPSMDNHPTSVVVTPDGDNVLAWHDAQILPTGQHPGVLVYDKTSRTISNLLADKHVLRVVVPQDPHAKDGFAIVKDDPLLYWISIESLDTRTYPMGLKAGTAPVALATAGDGQRVFAVAADADRNLSLVVLEPHDGGWASVQTLALYQATPAGRILLRSTPDGTTLFLVDVDAAQVRVLRRAGRDFTLSPARIAGEVRARDLAVLPDGSTAYVLNAGAATNTITVIDVASLGSHVAAVPQPYVNLTGIQPAPDGRRLFATDTNAAALRILDPRSLRILQTVPLKASGGKASNIAGLAVTADGSSIFTANTGTQNLSIVEQIQMGTAVAAAAPRPFRAPSADAYSGLFMRHYLKEQPGSGRDGWSDSPDVIPYGLSIEPDLEKFTSQAGYAKDLGQDVTTSNVNYVYVRGKNYGAAEITSRVYFYYTRGTLAMWPANWTSDNVTVNNEPRNWVDVTAAPGSVAVGKNPFAWKPDPLAPGADHYCVIGWAVDGPNPQPPDFDKYRQFATQEELIQFIVAHHNMAWRNTRQVLKPPANFSYDSALTAAAGGLTVSLQVNFIDVPDDGEFSVNMQGSDKDNSVELKPAKLLYYQGGFIPRNNPLHLEADFKTSVSVQYWKKDIAPPPTARIQVLLWAEVPRAMVDDIERWYRPRGLRTPITLFGGVPSVRVGSAQHNLLFGSQADPAGV